MGWDPMMLAFGNPGLESLVPTGFWHWLSGNILIGASPKLLDVKPG